MNDSLKTKVEKTMFIFYKKPLKIPDLLEILHEAYDNKNDAVDTAEAIFKLEGYACVEVISNNDCEGDYGVVAHFEEALSELA